MRIKHIVFAIVGLVAVVALAEVTMYTVFHRHIHLMHNVDDVKEYPQLSVDAVLKEPTRYTETIAVEGVVGEVTKSSASFTLIGSVPTVRLKVEYNASLPSVSDNVVVIGTLKKISDAEYALVAREIELR